MSNGKLWVILIVCVLTLVSASPASLTISEDEVGFWSSHEMTESYKLSTGLTVGGKPGSPKLYSERKEVFKLPQYYGNLIGVTGSSSAAVFWFQDGDGVIRNAVIQDASDRGVRIEYGAVTNFKTTARRVGR